MINPTNIVILSKESDLYECIANRFFIDLKHDICYNHKVRRYL